MKSKKLTLKDLPAATYFSFVDGPAEAGYKTKCGWLPIIGTNPVTDKTAMFAYRFGLYCELTGNEDREVRIN